MSYGVAAYGSLAFSEENEIIAAVAIITQDGNTSSSVVVVPVLADSNISQDGNVSVSTASVPLVVEFVAAQDANTSQSDGVVFVVVNASVSQAGDTLTSVSGEIRALPIWYANHRNTEWVARRG